MWRSGPYRQRPEGGADEEPVGYLAKQSRQVPSQVCVCVCVCVCVTATADLL